MKPTTITQFSTAGLMLLGLCFSQPSWAQFRPETLAQLPAESSGPGFAGPSTVIYNAPPLPPGQGAPTGRRDGGASRGNCEAYGDLTALVPLTDGVVWGQTTTAQPTLWFYLPTAVTPETPLELVVQDANDNFLYTTTLAVDMAAGSLAIALPETIELPVDEPHYWTMSVYCDPERPAASVFVQGTIERAAAAEVAPFSADTERSLAQAQAYASRGIWYDALTILGQRLQGGADVESQQAWTALLEQVGLEAAAAAPVLPCCLAEPTE
ncbi:MAG: DUF928 domain-containing protein [Elainellaceae cyanobacterium]